MNPEHNPELSVLLATRNNAGMLDQLLSGLLLCKPPGQWEVLVVDNGSTDDTQKRVSEYLGRLPVRYLYHAKPGKSRALNMGLRYVRGDLVVFTDDDINPDRDWLVNIVRIMQLHPEINVLGGRIRIDKTSVPYWIANSYNLKGLLLSEHELGNHEIRYAPGKYPYGPNLTVRKKQVAGITNPWPEGIGPGTRLPVGDEMIFISNIKINSQECLYTPECMVEHKPVMKLGNYYIVLKRCFLGGYAAGLYGNEVIGKTSWHTIIELVKRRIRSCRSIREFFCLLVRACGVYLGKYRSILFGKHTP